MTHITHVGKTVLYWALFQLIMDKHLLLQSFCWLSGIVAVSKVDQNITAVGFNKRKETATDEQGITAVFT